MPGMSTQVRSLCVTIGVAIAAAAAPVAQAAPLLWTLDATFAESPRRPAGPARVTGSFTYDPVSNVHDGVMIDVSALVLSGFLGFPSTLSAVNTTTLGNASAVAFSARRNTFDPTRPENLYVIARGSLRLSFADPLTAAGGIIALSGGGWLSEVSIIDPLRPDSNLTLIDAQDLAAGTVSATPAASAVPEPAGLGLAVMALGLFGAAARARASRPRAAVSGA